MAGARQSVHTRGIYGIATFARSDRHEEGDGARRGGRVRRDFESARGPGPQGDCGRFHRRAGRARARRRMPNTARRATARTWTMARSRRRCQGLDFRQKWGDQSPEALFTKTSTTMPPARPGLAQRRRPTRSCWRTSCARTACAPATRDVARASASALKALALPAWPRGGGGGLAPGATVPPAPARANPLEKIRPVTDAMLTRAADGEWLTWRRTYDAFGFSPLKKINKSERRAIFGWRGAGRCPNGPNEPRRSSTTACCSCIGYGDKVQALDAATGDLLWQYSRRLPQGVPPSVKRGISIYGTQALRAHLRRPHRRARREDRPRGVGSGGRRSKDRHTA